MRLIKSNDPALLCRIFKVYVRPIVETCSATYVVTTKKEIEQLESVQRRFTKAAFIRAFPEEDLPDYRERCRRLELDTLEERRIRSDLILAKKILLGKCGTKNVFRFKQSRTRGGATKFDIPYCRTKMRESTFFVRVASTLSKLNVDFVLNSSLGVFKEFVKDLNLADADDSLQMATYANTEISLKDLISLCWQIFDGMIYLSSKGYIHRDLAARNILLTDDMRAKISDFGLCRFTNEDLYVTYHAGKMPIRWLPPEALSRANFSTASDV
ncbi:Protein F09A5.2 [Aphelenchoides avenae]|nr:Protein F09A5.2 [Aphelenchus avenae]